MHDRGTDCMARLSFRAQHTSWTKGIRLTLQLCGPSLNQARCAFINVGSLCFVISTMNPSSINARGCGNIFLFRILTVTSM
jgi:hypothetical protein